MSFHKLNLSYTTYFCFICLSLTLLLVACNEERTSSKLPAAAATPTIIPATTIPATLTGIPRPTHDPADKSPPEKQAATDTQEAGRAIARLTPAATVDPKEIEAIYTSMAYNKTPRPVPTWDHYGIVIAGTPPFLRPAFVTTNAWLVNLNNRNYTVYAGKAFPVKELDIVYEQDQGAIYVLETSIEYNSILAKTLYLTPILEGRVKIVEENKHRLTLQTEKGNKLIFNFNTRQFEK